MMHNAMLTNEHEAEQHRVVTDAVHAAGGKIALQILHTGRYSPAQPGGAVGAASRSTLPPGGAEQRAKCGKPSPTLPLRAPGPATAGYDGVEVMGWKAI